MDFASLQHSVFLQSLGSAILNSLWQGFILWFLYETISASYKTASARLKNSLSTVLVFLSFIWFGITFFSKIVNSNALIAADVAAGLPHHQIASQPVSVFEKLLGYAGSSVPYLSVAYIFLLFFLMAKLLTAYRYVYIISNKRLSNPPAELSFFTFKVAAQMKIPRKITVWISNHIDVPATIGFIKPVILIPFASLNNLTGSQLEAIILHELSHIKRNDYILNIILSVIETVLFFNPFVALLSTVIKRERENCCDDFVLQYQYDPLSYASALLRLEQSRVNTLKLAIGAVSGKKQLLSRIKRITNGHAVTRQFNYGQKLLALFLVTIIITSVAWLSPQGKKQVNTASKIEHVRQVKTQTIISFPKAPKAVNNKKEILQPKILKDVLTKKSEISFTEPDMQVPSFQDGDINFDEVEPSHFKNVFPKSLKDTHLFLDSTKFKFLPSINLQNFPFQNMEFNIDFSKNDLVKLNENLKQAYKQIDAIDWTKIGNEIQESLSKSKINNFLSKEQIQRYLEKAENLSKLRDQLRQYNSDVIKERIERQPKRYAINIARLVKVEKGDTNEDNQYARNINSNFYTIESPCSAVSTDENNDAPVFGYKSLSVQNKNVIIAVNRTSQGNFKKAKALFQLSLAAEPNTQDSKKVITIEVND